MDVLTQLNAYLHRLLIEPVAEQFFSLFDLNGRIGVVFIFTSYCVAYGLFRFRKSRRLTEAPTFWQFLGGGRVHGHRSAWLDYRYYFIKGILRVALVLPVVALVDPHILRSGDYVQFFTRLWGAREQVWDHPSIALFYGLGVFVFRDFLHYWIHRAFHSRFLWEFHKVHHSALVLVPVTASRIHIVESIFERIVITAGLGAFAGVVWYACGGEVSRYTLFGVTWLALIINGLGANLRHSHVWLSFGPKVEHVLNSPAQHQIHHSDAPRHFNKNFAINLSLWDWMFGTLYVTTPTPEVLRFGTGEQDRTRYLTVYSLIVTPFVDTAKRLSSNADGLRTWFNQRTP
ncbi:sterol desaturase family protein [Pseudomonas sp. HS6]|uniref:sterol desaturase family protein n=1 Tax=Pseudomonas sp. HS6 TaxID=2850559 RepID=UPI002019EC07|nr:sterol desaturase family protein [Pseudomonas sp. HS6]UQS17521.1 sterol desaturase family protein [Pseudomonas sp. HS6]